MTLAPHPVYRTAARSLGVGSVVSDVIVTFRRGGLVPALNPVAPGVFQATGDFALAYRSADPRQRERGLPVAVLAKPRPIVVLAVGAVEEDTVHANDIWVLPFYSQEEGQRSGRNLFELPAWAPAGFETPGYLDFFQVTLLPRESLAGRPRPCDLQPMVTQALLEAFRGCLAYG